MSYKLPMPKNALIQAFHQLEAFKWNQQEGFRLASGKTSPYYVDCRIVLAHPHSRHLVAQLAYHRLKSLDFTLIGGLEIGAIPLATCISDFGYRADPQREWRTFVVRKQPKDHGLGKLIEGTIHPGETALVVDDVLTTGGSLVKAAESARAQGLIVTHGLVVVDRSGNEGKSHLAHMGIQLLPLLTLEDLRQTSPSTR
ncbi:orotate phosphoribosyltransferase [Nitrospira sp. MA-1]|nr:orotate phosphoribosyltransferase [Nitrospira sp. MA-1]